jgi:hypothetical protein
MKSPYPTETGCCSRFDPEPWQEKELQWEGKLFVKDRVWCLFYMPMNFGKVMVRTMEKIDQASALTPQPPIALSDHTSPWNMDLYVEVSKEVPGANQARLSGTFLSKVFEGPFKQSRQWCQQMSKWVASKGKAIKRQFMYYTTCPRCAAHYGKNYVVILAEV